MAAEILVINAGSSSIKMSVFDVDPEGPRLRIHARVENVGTPHPRAVAKDKAGVEIFNEHWRSGGGPKTHDDAIKFLFERLGKSLAQPSGIGHRVVHGGTQHRTPVRIDEKVRADLETLIPLAPLHQPANLEGIDAALQSFPEVPQVACFDTASHSGRPRVAEAFALPREYYDAGVRRYGFHGISYEYISLRMQKLDPEVARGRMIVCHLGNGASLCAIRDGRCVDTTMGFTALEGLPMGTRCGQLDPGVVLYLLDAKKLDTAAVSDLLYKKSGLLGLSGTSSDMRELLAADSTQANEAIDYFVYRITWYIGALTAALSGLDALVFTAGIGEHAAPIRERVCRNLAWLGLKLDDAANQAHRTLISAPDSKLSIWVVPTNEELMIARHVVAVLGI